MSGHLDQLSTHIFIFAVHALPFCFLYLFCFHFVPTNQKTYKKPINKHKKQFNNILLILFGLFFLRQARKDARLFESDFYAGMQKKLVNFLPRKRST
jgi:hypothetical protein